MRLFAATLFLVCIFSLSSRAGSLDSLLSQPLLDSASALEEMNAFIRARIPALEIPASAEDWIREAETIRERVLSEVVFRGAPETWSEWKAQAEWTDTLEAGEGYRIRKLRYEFLPGMWTTALLYEPEPLEGKVPAVLNVNGHVGPPGKAYEEEQIRCINQAQKGVLALHPEWLSFGELQGDGYNHNNLGQLDVVGVSGLAVFYLAMRGGLDILLDHPNTDPERVGMTGLSGGGWQTILLSSLDTRIRATVPNAGYSGLEERTVHRGSIGDLEQNPSDQVSVADFTHLTAILAPRPALLIYNEKDNCCFEAAFAKASVYDPVVPIYQLFGKAEDFQYHENKDPGTHNYGLDNRQAFYRFLYQYFLPDKQPDLAERHTPEEILEPEALYVGLPEHNETFFSLAQAFYETSKEPAPLTPQAVVDLLRITKLSAEAELVSSTQTEAGEARGYLLSMREWTVPAVVIERGAASQTIVALADKGRAALAEVFDATRFADSRLIVIDPVLIGENVPGEVPPPQYNMMIDTIGQRPLGIQAAQIAAVAEWACREFRMNSLSLLADGWTSETACRVAAVLAPSAISEVQATHPMGSLHRLLEQRVSYNDHPGLFAFGLLARLDLPDLEALHSDLRGQSAAPVAFKEGNSSAPFPQAETIKDPLRRLLRPLECLGLRLCP